ncbi:hypothetical protein FOZ61_000091 [Perkinsus olseni]|uniref:Feruloyl esterase n=1 Tax=Perkinsus olseni TaxID=32597 RepID=A0A7J6MG37_PEROL|nr:hypothetical protein FOZ61_000091 [Perkinsus olseni]
MHRPIATITERRGVANPVLGGVEDYRNLTHQNGARFYYVYTPNTTTSAILFNIHGLGDSCQNFRHTSGLVDLADENGLMVVTPCGLRNGFYLHSWNAGVCCQTNKNIDDFGFIKAILSDVNSASVLPVFTAGFSNGGMMAEGLLCLNIVTRAVSVSGVVVLEPGNEGGIKTCTGSFTELEAKVANVHGTFDPVVPYGGNSLFGFPPVEDDMKAWSSRLGCDTSYSKDRTDQKYDFLEYEGCQRKGSRVLLVRHNWGVHTWHGSGDFNTPRFVVDFLLGKGEERAAESTTRDFLLEA